jgi:peptide/nickel transport system permease protein
LTTIEPQTPAGRASHDGARRPFEARRIARPALALARAVATRALTVLVASFLIFVALNAAPGDPVRAALGPHASPAAVAHERRVLGLDHPLIVRYWDWLTHALSGNFGTSIVYKTSVGSLLEPRIGTTVFLVFFSLVLTVVGGLVIGLLGGAFPRLSAPTAALTGVFLAIPAFVAAQVLVVIFALHLGWLPVSGDGVGFFGQLQHLTLPAISLAVGWSAWIAQVTRTAIRETASLEHVDTARGRGIATRRVFRRHVLRNASIPIITVSGLTLAALFAGAVVVENAFSLNGLGSLLVSSVSSKDYSVVLAVSVIFVAIFVVVTSAIDALHIALDPRIRHGRTQ